MKFHCDRCKTRYSIADERVRGKILKIRCKNCSAVITVREGMGGDPAGDEPVRAKRPSTGGVPAAKHAGSSAAPAKRAASGGKSSLQGAFEKAIQRPPSEADGASPSPSDSFRAPDHFEQEWYLSVDGDQAGPFNLEEAKDWVASRKIDDEVFCWQEDFDDWLPLEKVSHFRGLRSDVDTVQSPQAPPGRHEGERAQPMAASAAMGLGAQVRQEETPQPLFGPTLAALEAEQRSESDAEEAVAAAVVPRAPIATPPTNGASEPPMLSEDAALEFDIGEASRIVKLPILPAPGSGATAAGAGIPERSKDPVLPGVAKIAKTGGALGMGTGSVAAMNPLAPLSTEALADAQVKVLTPSKKPSHTIHIAIGVGAVALIVGASLLIYSSGQDDGPGLARGDLGGDRLGRRFDTRGPGKKADAPDVMIVSPEKKWKPRTTRPNGPKVTKDGTNGTNGTGPAIPSDPGTLRPLGPQEVVNESIRNKIGNRRCYERALKKDPFLDVDKIKVRLTVAASGVVSNLKMASYAESFLGQCLSARIRKWSFRKSTKGITMDLTLSFGQSN